jgi:phenylalanine-4-hydroxylase
MSNMLQNDSVTEERSFSSDAHLMWQKLFSKQITNLKDKAFPTYLINLEKLGLLHERIPTIEELNIRLSATGWQVIPVTGLIQYELYFELLANRKFPIAMIMRLDNEENLCKDPDVFHEIFGHCTMLITPEYANFMQEFAKFALTIKKTDRPIFARLIWFTTETGLINTEHGLRIFGSSILSSYTESIYCLESHEPIRKPFNIVNIFREPYRADILQKTYYILENTNQVYGLLNNTNELYEAVKIARELGEFIPRFPITHDKYSNIGHCHHINEFANIS